MSTEILYSQANTDNECMSEITFKFYHKLCGIRKQYEGPAQACEKILGCMCDVFNPHWVCAGTNA